MFYTKEKFQSEIEEIVEYHDVTYLEAIMMFCQEKTVDSEDIIPLITPYLKNKLLIEGMDCGFLKKEPTVTALFSK